MKQRLVLMTLIFLITLSTSSAMLLSQDSAMIKHGGMLGMENGSKTIILNANNIFTGDKNVGIKENDTNNSNTNNNTIGSLDNKNNTCNISRSRDTITIYCYPSSWQDDYPYHQYKVTWLASITDICDWNPKGTFEGEWTRRCDDMDFSGLTGLEKDYHGASISEYLVKIEGVD